jgi:hypothetical protein
MAHALHKLSAMPNTTFAQPDLPSIDNAALLFVSGGCGGCHKHRCCSQNQQTIINMPQPAQQAVPQVLPQAAPAPSPDPMAAAAQQAPMGPTGPSGDVVSTNVSINGQPVG